MHTTEQLNAALAGRYAIDRLIGEGGMATVYLARDVKHNRRVAVKVLRPDLGAVVGVERFLAEIEVTANLQHPNLLPLFDSGEAGGLLFYVMPYVEGESLRARLERERQLPIEEAVRLATAVAGALDYAHRHGVIHRDLKPENILLHDGQPLVADFGIALAVSNAGGNRITQTGLSLGTPHYMSPEQATGDRAIDARTDVYSLGAVTYEMLVGEPPHTGSSSQAIIARVLTEKPRSIRSSRPNVPPHIEAAIEHALDKLPADRLANAKEFADALNGARVLTSTAFTNVTHSATATTGRSRLQRVRECVLGAIALLGVAGVMYFATRTPKAPVSARFAIVLPDSTSTSLASAQSVALSRDGKILALLLDHGGEHQIYLRRLEDPDAQPVRGTDGAQYPSFSNDGRWLVFRAENKLKSVSIDGGVPQTLADSAGTVPASWGPNGEIAYTSGNAIWLVSADGGHRRRAAGPDSAHGIYALTYPSIMPDGKRALVTIGSRGGNITRRLGMVSLIDGKITDWGIPGRTSVFVPPNQVVFSREGGMIFALSISLRTGKPVGSPVLLVESVRQATGGATAFAVADNGTLAYESGSSLGSQTMYLVDHRGVARALPSEPRAFQEPRVSPDGRRIAVRIGNSINAGGLWIYDIASGTLTRLTPDDASVRGEWTRDGKNVVHMEYMLTDSERVVSRPWDGSGHPRTLFQGKESGSPWDFSLGSAGGFIALRNHFSPNGDITIAPVESLSAQRPMVTNSANDANPKVSPDGELLAYISDKTGRWEVYVTPIPGPGAHVQVSINMGTEPLWSRDGKTLFYRSATKMMAATIVRKPALEIARRDSLFTDDYARSTAHGAGDIMPDGHEFLMLRGVLARSSIFVIVNWPQMNRMRDAVPAR